LRIGRIDSQRGFTLIELLAVMTIIGVLAGIVVPAVSGTKEASNDAEVREGAFTVQSATNDFFAAQTSAEVVKPLTRRLNANINGEEGINDAFTQKIGTRWPEKYVTDHDTHMGAYAVEFRTSTTTTESKVRKVILRDQDGSPISRVNLLLRYTALDFDILSGLDESDSRSEAFLSRIPGTVDSLSQGEYHDYLWLLKKSTSAHSSNNDNSREVAVFKLTRVEQDESASDTGGHEPSMENQVVLSYDQIF
jgi:prepilin-type N-terminal cleavage/methylation domain-containing protein